MMKTMTKGSVEVVNSHGVTVRVAIRVWQGSEGFWASAKANNRGKVERHATRGAALAWAFAEAQGLVERGCNCAPAITNDPRVEIRERERAANRAFGRGE